MDSSRADVSPVQLPSVLILTLNEERNLPQVIKSFPPSVDITVYDSFSSDKTLDVAKQFGARVVQRHFDNWAAHQNWAVENIEFPSPWVYYSDADERMTPELWQEICRAIQNPGGRIGFEIRRKDYFGRRWIRHSSFYPCWFLRLFQPPYVRWERLVHVVPVANGPTGRLSGHFLHYPLSKGVGFWFARHINYADLEAQELIYSRINRSDFGDLLRGTPRERRKALKRVFQALPARPILKFTTLYLLRRGFLDGAAGFRYAIMQAIYEYMISVRLAELRGRL